MDWQTTVGLKEEDVLFLSESELQKLMVIRNIEPEKQIVMLVEYRKIKQGIVFNLFYSPSNLFSGFIMILSSHLYSIVLFRVFVND